MKINYKKALLLVLILLLLLNVNTVYAIDYNNICGEKGVQQAVTIIGYVVFIVRVLAPIAIIVFGMIDFGKAVTSNDEKAINKSTGALLRRIIAGALVFFAPILILVFLDAINVTDRLESKDRKGFGACTRCILNVSECNF